LLQSGQIPWYRSSFCMLWCLVLMWALSCPHTKYIKVSYIAETFAAERTDLVVQIQLLHVVVLGPHVGAQLPTHKIYKG
jgi:hypothetical protein